MGGHSANEPWETQLAQWLDPADDLPEDWEDDEPDEFEPDPELLRRIEQSSLH